MGWFSDFVNEQYEDAADFFTDDIGEYVGGAGGVGSTLLGLGLGYLADKSGIADPKLPVVGYQGSIPEYSAVRERVPMQEDPNRRPGSTGRRYFSDTIFAQKPETEPMTVEEARKKAAAQAQGIAAGQPPAATPVEKEYDPDAEEVGMAGPDRMFATGGIANLSQGRYLGGATDGQADKVPARIDNGQEARLSDGEFVLPADLVALLGNGNSNAGAKKLHEFMDKVRRQGTGKETQQKNIDAGKELSMLLG
tara:strand:- start:273 stop:1025 length:753 start_codon:yes stop_codon:yes gene_type:complete